MGIRPLSRLMIGAPLLIVAVLEYSRWALGPMLSSWTGRLLMDAVVVAGAITFYAAGSSWILRMTQRLERQNRELQALRHASLDIAADLALESVLQRIVDQARNLLDCRYGALAVYDKDDRLESFVTSGIDEERKKRIGSPPVGEGLLRLPLRDHQRLRLKNLREHAYSSGFPEHHPEMRSLLAVPVICHSKFRGNLYLSEKIDGSEMTAKDEEILVRFASQAAVAVDNAELHAKVAGLAVMDERLRLAREMHDGQAQVLAYVNTKAQVVDQLLTQGEIESAREHLHQMAAAAREVYTDVREGILGLRAAIDHDHELAHVLRDYGERWEDQAGIPLELEVDGDSRYPREVELQVLRVIQEALANARKHSRAETVWLRVVLHEDCLSAEIEDDGVGFGAEASESGTLGKFGLATMRERCESIGAVLEIRSRVGQGTRIRVAYTPTRRRSGTLAEIAESP